MGAKAKIVGNMRPSKSAGEALRLGRNALFGAAKGVRLISDAERQLRELVERLAARDVTSLREFERLRA